MKKFFTFFLSLSLVLVFSSGVKAQVEIWREGFNSTNIGISGTNPVTSGGNNNYWSTAVESAPWGSWYFHNTYRTSGTGCGGAANQHLRALQNAADSPYWAAPPVPAGLGVKEVHFFRSGVTVRRVAVYVSTDTTISTTNNPYSAVNTWTLVGVAGTTAPSCTDTFITVPPALAPNVLRVAFVNSQLANLDIDSISIVTNSGTVPVAFAGINANYNSGVVKVAWNNQTEISTTNYIIERSTDGTNFTSIGTVKATNVRSYGWYDNAPVSGTNYYRIKAVDANGLFTYSSIVRISAGALAQGIVVSPNPVRGRNLNLQLNNFVRGNYTVSIFNSNSQKVFSSTVSHNGGNSVQTVSLPGTVGKGFYSVHVTNGSVSFTKSIVVE